MFKKLYLTTKYSNIVDILVVDNTKIMVKITI